MTRILIAGIGNIFMGDDAFGVEVVRRMAARPLPAGAFVRDFGIRGFDLAYALNDAWDAVILVDALSRSQAPGTVFVLEPSRDDLEGSLQNAELQPHGMDPVQAIRLAKSLGALPRRLLVVGCQPANLGGEEGSMGLSSEVEAAIDLAIGTIEQLLSQSLAVSA